MALVEYSDGSPFSGVIGRTADESSPAWPAPMRARKGAPERAVRRARRHRLRPPRLLRQPDRDAELRRARRRRAALHQHAHHGAVLAEPLVHPHRAQPPQQRRWPASPSSPPAIPGYNGIIPFENGMLSEMLLAHGYNTFMVGKWHLTPSNQETAAGPVRPLAARPRVRALLRLPRRRHEPVVSRPRLRQPPGRAAGDARRRATTSPRTWSTSRSSSSPTPSRSTPTSRSTCTCASARRTRRTTCPRSGPTSTPGKFDDGWDAYREKIFARQKELGIIPADAELSRHDPDVPDWDSLPAEARRLYSPR